MKHNFLAWRHLDAAAETKAGGSIVEAIEKNHKLTTEQIQAVKSAHEKALSDIEEKHKKAIEALTKANDEDIQKIKSLVSQLEKDLTEQKQKAVEFANGVANSKTFTSEFEQVLLKEENIKAIKEKQPNFPVELNTKAFGVKAVGDMASATNLTGSYLATPDVRGGIIMRPYEQLHMRDLLPIGRTTSGIIRHVRDNGGEGGPGMVAEMGTKPQMDRDLSIEDAPVRKIATHMRVPEEMVEDIPYLTTFLSNIGIEEVMAVEDQQIIYGDGTGQNLSGLFTLGTTFAPGAAAKFPVGVVPNRFDVLRAARMQMRKAKRVPSFALVSPLDYYVMTSTKDTTGNYVLLGGGNGLVPTLDGVPIVEMNQMTDGDFLLGDRRAAEINFRQNVVVRFYDQDRDNAIKNAITIVIEERVALPVYYTNGFVKGTFGAGITALTTAA